MCGKTLLAIDGGGIWFTGVVKYLRAVDQYMDFKLHSRIAHFVMKNLPLQKYMRVAPIISKEQDYALDAVEHIADINEIWNNQFRETRNDVLNFLKGG